MSYAVIACASCREPWAVQLRQATASCPACATQADLASHVRLWEGALPQDAQAVAANRRLVLRSGPEALRAVELLGERPAHTLPRHDSPVDAAAAQGVGIRNRSERAEAVASALTRLRGGSVLHSDLILALERSGLDAVRSEAEIIRMLATDCMVEPRAGCYRFLGGGA